MATADKLRETFSSLLGEARNLVVDLRETLFIDSTVISTLLQASEDAGRDGRRLILCFGTTAPVRRVLEITGVHTAVPVYEDCDDAIAVAKR